MTTLEQFNPYSPPSREADADAQRDEPHGFWREGTMLVVSRTNTRLPDRCVTCNAPALGYRVTATVIGNQPGLVALLLGRFVRVEVGLCPKHRKLRGLGAVLILSGLCCPLLVGLGVEWWLGMLLFSGGILAGLHLRRVARGGRIDAQHARLKVGVPFLLSVPSRLPGRPPPSLSL